MAPVGKKPWIAYLLDWLIKQGFQKVILSIGYKAERFLEILGKSYKSLELKYVKEDEPLGTGGAIKYALPYCKNEEVFILNADSLADVPLQKICLFHENHNGWLTMAVIPPPKENPYRYGSVIIDPDTKQVLKFEEKRNVVPEWINAGIYLANKSNITNYLEHIDRKVFSWEHDVLPYLALQKLLYAFTADAPFLDIGIPSDYQRASAFLKEIGLL